MPVQSTQHIATAVPPVVGEFGPWMLVQRHQKRKPNLSKEDTSQGHNQRGIRSYNRSPNDNSFAILGEEAGEISAQLVSKGNQTKGGNQNKGGQQSMGNNGIVIWEGKNVNDGKDKVKFVKNGGSSQTMRSYSVKSQNGSKKEN